MLALSLNILETLSSFRHFPLLNNSVYAGVFVAMGVRERVHPAAK